MVCAQTACAQTEYYVATNGTGNGSSWAAATNSIQGAIDASDDDTASTVWVSNGVYDTGGLAGYPIGSPLTNRVSIWKAITVRSLNNDRVNTIIKGAWVAATSGSAAVRGVYMTNGASLVGFTVTNGSTVTWVESVAAWDDTVGAGIWSQSTNTVITNCLIAGNAAHYTAGGVYKGTLYNSVVSANSVVDTSIGQRAGTSQSIMYNCQILNNFCPQRATAGAWGGTLYDCLVSGNTSIGGGGATFGAGAGGATLYDCNVVSNYQSGSANGAGAAYCTLTDSTVAYNTAQGGYGGGGYACTLYNCIVSNNWCSVDAGGLKLSKAYNTTIVGNKAGRSAGGAESGTFVNCKFANNYCTGGWGTSEGGGVSQATVTNCLIIGNTINNADATQRGGGARACTIFNSTIADNYAATEGGGVSGCTLTNCISWGNNVTDHTYTASYSCGTNYPLVSGNITNNPLFVGGNDYSLGSGSPCIDRGVNQGWMSGLPGSLDLAGNNRIRNVAVDMGAYEAAPPEGSVVLIL